MKIPKIIALDIDGTLFDSKGKISQRTLKAIHACTQAGINVVFSTGRDYDSLPLAETEGSGMQYAVTTNGSAIYELGSRKCLWENPMDCKDTFDILNYSENDLDILRAAGTGIAMGNAPTDIKRYADEVTLSNDEDGVAVVLERILSLI